MPSQRVQRSETPVSVRSLRASVAPARRPAVANKTIVARLSLSPASLARLLLVSGSDGDWILSSKDGSTTVKVRLSVGSIPDASLTLGRSNVELDWTRSTLSLKGRQVSLTKMELRLLGALLEQHPGTATKQHLCARLWPTEKTCRDGEGALAVWIHALRRHFSALGLSDVVVTVRSEGYRLDV